MQDKEPSVLQKLRKVIHWIALAIVIYIFGYAGLYKIIGVPDMMNGMADMGFSTTITFLIGLAETAAPV